MLIIMVITDNSAYFSACLTNKNLKNIKNEKLARTEKNRNLWPKL